MLDHSVFSLFELFLRGFFRLISGIFEFLNFWFLEIIFNLIIYLSSLKIIIIICILNFFRNLVNRFGNLGLSI